MGEAVDHKRAHQAHLEITPSIIKSTRSNTVEAVDRSGYGYYHCVVMDAARETLLGGGGGSSGGAGSSSVAAGGGSSGNAWWNREDFGPKPAAPIPTRKPQAQQTADLCHLPAQAPPNRMRQEQDGGEAPSPPEPPAEEEQEQADTRPSMRRVPKETERQA